MKRRAKGTTRRKATTFVVSDENVDPDEGLRGCKDGVAVTQQDADAMEVDENQDPLQTTTSLKEKISVAPTERKVVGIARSILSPTKINGEARVSVSPQSSFLPSPACNWQLRTRILRCGHRTYTITHPANASTQGCTFQESSHYTSASNRTPRETCFDAEDATDTLYSWKSCHCSLSSCTATIHKEFGSRTTCWSG